MRVRQSPSRVPRGPGTESATGATRARNPAESVRAHDPGPASGRPDAGDATTRKHSPGDATTRQHGPGDATTRKHGPGDATTRQPGPGDATTRQRGPGAATRLQDPAPRILDRYRLVRRLGAGGFGTVWQARDERLHRYVAIKLLPRERVMTGRFEREARAAARLAHPAIVTLYEAAIDEEGAYLVSELISGATLAQLLDAGRLSDRDIVIIGAALCDALGHAHAQGVVHRDVKPSNILVPERPATAAEVAKLTDFGVARVLGGDTLTRSGDVLGTAAYMAPEQAEGRVADAAADLYSLALVIYEALTGVNPVPTNGRGRRLGAYLPPIRRQRRDLPRALAQSIDLALRPRPGERGTIEDLRAALAEAAGTVGDAPGVVASPWGAPHAEDGRARDEREKGGDNRDQRECHAAPRAIWRRRALAGATAGGLTAWAITHLLPHPPLAPAAAALMAAMLIAALPAVGWFMLSAALIALLVAHHSTGGALILALAAATPVILMPRAPTNWPLPFVTPALGVVALAGAWPALAAKARNAWSRAALGAAGWVWLMLAEPLTGKDLYTKRAIPPSHWMDSASAAAGHVLKPLLSSGLPLVALVWAAGAALLPVIRSRRSRALNLLAVILWTTVVAVSTATVLGIHHARIMWGEATLGAVAAAFAALAPDVTSTRWTGAARRTPRPDLRSMELS